MNLEGHNIQSTRKRDETTLQTSVVHDYHQMHITLDSHLCQNFAVDLCSPIHVSIWCLISLIFSLFFLGSLPHPDPFSKPQSYITI